jgi:phosphoribosylformylglycinamidine cyclo-ligase
VSNGDDAGLTYADAGVDVEAGERAVELMRSAISRAQRAETVGAVGGFAGLFDASALTRFRRPLLATSTDGVGTKIDVARRMDVHDTVGIDLVAMVVDDLVVCGAEPLFLTDYIAVGAVVPERVAAIVQGIAEGCQQAGTALLGGETAEHPGLLDPDEYDLAAAGTGVVEADDLLGPHLVRDGDLLVACASSGLHSNGFSLARRVFFDRAGWDVHRHVPELGRSLGEELLEPTRIYALDILDAIAAGGFHAISHITGGGIAANIARVLPSGLHADVDRATWAVPAVFRLISELGGVSQAERERTFNEGLGMVCVVGEESAAATVDRLGRRGVPAWICGSVRTARPEDLSDAPAKGGSGGSVAVVGTHKD